MGETGKKTGFSPHPPVSLSPGLIPSTVDRDSRCCRSLHNLVTRADPANPKRGALGDRA
jgi:hypothetical protein